MKAKEMILPTAMLVIVLCMGFARCQDEDLDMQSDLTGDMEREEHSFRLPERRHPKFHGVKTEVEFDIQHNRNVSATDNSKIHGMAASKTDHKKARSHKKAKGGEKHSQHDAKGKKSKGTKRRKMEKEKQEEQERRWYHCADGRSPKDVKELAETEQSGIGHMCRDLYPISTCCYDHDLTMELVGDKILEQIPEIQCAKMLMRLRCSHCSPRSWWLHHASDKVRYPHKRVLPIMCPSFCRKFHRLCRDSVAGLEDDKFCDYHTTNEEGPCFPDSFVRRGTID